MRHASNDRPSHAKAPRREWVTPGYDRLRAGDAELAPNTISPDGAFTKGS